MTSASFAPFLRAAIFATALIQTLNVFAQRDLKDIPVPDPKLEQATFRLPEGFEVNLFAADPIIAKPTQMNFDEDGRLWLVSSEVYPHIEPGAKATDRVIVIEDTDHDGVSDKTHVFADGLLIPTGIAPGDGGAYVANSTELLHFADTDGDLQADSKRIVLSGFGTEDTHHILHTLRWGPDGMLYFNQSIYIHSHIETPWGIRRLNAGGIWQFRPETLELGVFMRGLVNSWGHHFDRYGQSFATDGAGGEGINYVVPGAYYFTAADAPQILHGLNPGSPKHCGLEIVETPSLPPDWQGSAITNDFRGHRVCRFTLSEDRSGFVSREQQEVIWSDHVAFRPIDVKLGPDGAIYIADWYNPIIQHGEVDFRDPRRDHTHGRIWRVTWKGAPERKPQTMTQLTNVQLFESLRSKDNYTRQAAKQVLRQRGAEAAPDLDNWLAQQVSANAADEHLLLEALWCYQAWRQVPPALLHQLLGAEDHQVRAAAVRVLSHQKYQMPDADQLLGQLANDAHPRVRLEAVRALTYSPLEDSEYQQAVMEADSDDARQRLSDLRRRPGRIEDVMQAADHPTDTFLDYAIWLSTRESADDWLPAYRNGQITFGDNLNHVLSAFAAIGQGAPVDQLLPKAFGPSVTEQQQLQVVELILNSGTPAQIVELAQRAAMQDNVAVLQMVQTVTSAKGIKPPAVPDSLADALLNSGNPAVQQIGLRLAGQWQFAGYADRLTAVINDADQSAAIVTAAVDGIALSRNAELLAVLRTHIKDQAFPAALRIHAVNRLAPVQPQAAAGLAVELLQQLNANDRPGSIAAAFLAQKNGQQLLAGALADSSIAQDVARDLLRAIRESGQAAPQLESTVMKIGMLTSRKSITAEQKAALLAAVDQASAADGELIYRNDKFGCLKCHAIGGAGGQVGPDMISLGGSAQPDYLLESLLNPNAKVKENYHTVVVVTVDGKLQSGIQVQRSQESIVLRNADNQLVTIPAEDIDEVAQGLSLMPEGLVDVLTDQELASLVRFLSELGRTPEYTLSRRQLARTWDVLLDTPDAAFRLRRTSYAQAASDDPVFQWQRRYSTVAGHLPLNDVPQVSVRNRSAAGSRGVSFARCNLVVETAGTVGLKLNSGEGLELRLNDVPVDIEQLMTVNVEPGTYRLTFTIDQALRTEPLQLELAEEATTSVCRFQN
jgi:putative heme-binding domain-containing protein